MKNELKYFCEEKLISLSKRNNFNEKGVLQLWNDFIANKPTVTWSRIWMLVVLENWMEENKIEE
jgi:asparagine synthase (glutamine-hydrolysing)